MGKILKNLEHSGAYRSSLDLCGNPIKITISLIAYFYWSPL